MPPPGGGRVRSIRQAPVHRHDQVRRDRLPAMVARRAELAFAAQYLATRLVERAAAAAHRDAALLDPPGGTDQRDGSDAAMLVRLPRAFRITRAREQPGDIAARRRGNGGALVRIDPPALE